MGVSSVVHGIQRERGMGEGEVSTRSLRGVGTLSMRCELMLVVCIGPLNERLVSCVQY